MNDKFKMLALQAKMGTADFDAGSYYVATPEMMQQFAELIVQECVEQLRYTVLNTQELRRDKSTDYQVGWEDGMFDAGEMIKEHFRS